MAVRPLDMGFVGARLDQPNDPAGENEDKSPICSCLTKFSSTEPSTRRRMSKTSTNPSETIVPILTSKSRAIRGCARVTIP